MMIPTPASTIWWPVALVLALSTVPPATIEAAPPTPEITSMDPFVWKVGATNAVIIKGKNLTGVRGLWTSRHGLQTGEAVGATTDDAGGQLSLTVPIDGHQAPGPLAIRLVTTNGVTAAVMGMLEELPRLKVGAEGMLDGHGFVGGSIARKAGEQFRVRLVRNQDLHVEIVAGRFGSKLDPVLRILDESGSERFFVQDSPGLGVDCAAAFRAPNEGVYTIELRDSQYGKGNDLQFHLRLGTELAGWSSAQVREAEQHKDALASPAARMLAELQTKPMAMGIIATRPAAEASRRHQLAPLSGYPVIDFSAGTKPSAEKRQPSVVPDGASFNASLDGVDELQTYILEIGEPGPRRFVAMSRRFGGERDPVMRLKDTTGKTLAVANMFNNEAVLRHDFKRPGTYQLEVWDAAGQHGGHGGYHLRIERDPANFELGTETDALRIPAGGTAELTVAIDRDGYDGPVHFGPATPVDGVKLVEAAAKEDSKEAKPKLKLDDSLAPGTTIALKLRGRRGEEATVPGSPLFTGAAWRKRFPDLYSPMFEFEDTIWVTVLPKE